MTEPERKRGRTHDAEGARQAILNAAEEVFAEHGFDGARVDAIAAAAGYNKSLIFQYFEDKLGLYAAVIRRVDEQTRGLQAEILGALNEGDTAFNVSKLKTLVKIYLRGYFDYLVEHPNLMRILLWEMAEGWQTYSKILTQRDMEDLSQFRPVLEKVKSAGILRSDFDPVAQILLVEFIYPSYLALLPLYRLLVPGQDAPEALAQAREFIINFVVQGIFADGPDTAQTAE